ncbi:MAG: ATP-binding cassette domain-containing protein, partial [Actinobacteria bacterium]
MAARPRGAWTVNAPLLRFADASVGYGDGAVVTGVGLEVRPGRFVGLVGPNGAGKSTLLRAVTGAARLTVGTLEVAGRPAHALTPRERARLIAVVP